MSFKVRTWALGKTVSSLALIVSTWFLTASAVIPVTLADNSEISSIGSGGNSFSNITILDLYPELKDYLWQKALSQLDASTTGNNNYNNLATQKQDAIQNVPSAWDYGHYGSLISNINTDVNKNAYGTNVANIDTSLLGLPAAIPALGAFSRGDNADSEYMDTFKQYSEILKHYHPFGSPEIYSGWKYKPPPAPSYSTSANYPIWDEEVPEFDHTIGHELSKDVSVLAGILGLKALTQFKIASLFKKLKLIAVFFIAFKLGVLLSPIAIPLLFPIIIIATIAKLVPLILIIVLLLKILKKQVKPKKPFSKFLQRTSSLFFDDIDLITERVMKSEECVDKISCDLSRKSSERVKRVNNKRLEGRLEKSNTATAGDN